MISRRIKAIISFINDENRIIDVGCDHALVDIHSIKAGKTKTALAIDNNKKVVQEAISNIRKYQANNIEVLCNNGISNIDIKPDDLVIISGLGTRTIIKILQDPMADNINRMIVQSNNDQYQLRKILTKSFTIIDEKVIKDKQKYYVVMSLKRGTSHYSFMDLLLGPIIRKSNVEYMSYMKDKFKKILKQNKKKNIVIFLYLNIIIYFIGKDIKNV